MRASCARLRRGCYNPRAMLRSRYRRIVLFFLRVTVSLILWDLMLARVGLRGWVKRTRPRRLRWIAADFRALSIQMGGVLIKVGQFLSSRVDVLPDEITSELTTLQDEVPPEDFADIRRLAEAELGAPLSKRFASFDETPLAAASLGQVHRATLADGDALTEQGQIEDVVVKVQRPDIEAIIATDLAALRTLGSWLQCYRPIRLRADVPSMLAEFTRIIYGEIDYLAEGRNAETFAANFHGRSGVRVPGVAWTHTTKRVLTLEDVYAIKITDYEAVTAAGVEHDEVAARLFEVYLLQIFEDGFFHADPHPGNLFISPPTAGDKWVLTFVDFGMAGNVSPELRAGLRELAIALGTKDPERLVKSYQLLGVLLPQADLELLERAEAMALDRFWGRSMSQLREISMEEMRELGSEFREVVFSMPFQVPQDLILLGRTVAILSGICTGLHPEFNFWESIAPFAQKLVATEATSNWEFWKDELGAFVHALVATPRRMDAVLTKMQQGDLAVRIPRVADQLGRLELSVRRLAGALIFDVLLSGGAQLYSGGEILLGRTLLISALLPLAWMILSRRGDK